MAFLLAQWASSGRFDGWRGIALALALTAAAIAVRATAEPLAPASANFAPFFISSILSALFGGVWAGLVSLAAGLLAAWYCSCRRSSPSRWNRAARPACCSLR